MIPSAFALYQGGMHSHIVHIHAIRRLTSPAHQEVKLQVWWRVAPLAATAIGGGDAGHMGAGAHIYEHAATLSAG